MCVVIFGILVVIFIAELSRSVGYGEFRNHFKQDWTCLIYIVLSIVYRISLAVNASLNNQYQESMLIGLSICLCFFMYFIINLPFTVFYQNYRAGLIHLT